MDDTEFGGDLESVDVDQIDFGDDEDRDDDTPDVEEEEIDGDDETAGEEEPDEGEEPEEESDLGDAVITLPNGETMTVADFEDLRANGLRQADYTQKTTEIAQERKQVESLKESYSQRVQFLETTLQNLSGFVEGLIPPEPDLQLAQQNPGAYQYQKAIRDQAISEVRKLMEQKQAVDSQKQAFSAEDMQRYTADESAKLVKAMPHLADPAKRAAFDQANQKTAAEFGFSEDEIAQTADARILQLVHFARIGKVAEQNRRNARRRVETPKRGKAKPAPTQGGMKNREAMKRLSKSGSLDDALSVDFD